MQILQKPRRSAFLFSAVVIAIVMIGAVAAFEPVTRALVAQDAVCFSCHEEWEYNATSKVLWDGFKPLTRPHKATKKGGQASCVSCHSPEGMLGSVYIYTHFLTLTDFFGRLHEFLWQRQQGPWFPPAARRAYVVRDGFMENDSTPCRTCHIESKIKPKRKGGQKAHAYALKNKETCIECHDNLVHQAVPSRDESLETAK